MAERKSKPRKKEEDEEEPVGWQRVKQSPGFLLFMVFVIIVVVVGLLFGIARFLSQS